MNLYENLATHVKNAIRQGVYQPGDRLPSVRRLSEQHRVSQNTAVSAYRLLESHGWLEARPQSGFFARHPESSLPPAKARDNAEGPCTVSVTEVALRLCRNALQPDLVSLGAATPHPGYLPLGDLRAAFNRCLRDSNDVASRYSFPPGEESLRIRIAQRAAERGCAFGPDDVVVTDGCQEALNLALRAVAKAGDIIAIESPAFFGTLQAIESLGMQALEIPSDPVTGISLDALALALERWPVKAVAVVSNFSNPTGSLMPDANKTRLVKLLAARGIPLIEDDIYGDLAHGRTRPRPAKAYDRTDNVLLCASFSKTIAPGYRVGWIVPGRWHNTVEHLKYVSTMSSATLPQLAVAHYLADGRYERHLNKVRRTYADNLARMQAHIARHFPAGTRTSRPDGGFVLWVELPEHIDTLVLHDQALRQGISFTPGNLFSPQGRYRNCLRLAAALPWNTRVEQALEALGKLARRASPASHTGPSREKTA